MKQYLDLLKEVDQQGSFKEDRTGVGTKSIFGHQMRFNLAQGFPLVTTKKIHLPSVIHELLWFLNGETNISYLKQNNVKIWDEWASDTGELGPVYGKQWRSWLANDGQVHDQIANAIKLIKENPESRRIIVSAWNVGELEQMALMPCHALFQFYVNNNKLSLQLYQRSADLFLGVPFNIASYSLLCHMVAQQCDLEVGDFIWTGGDIHIYNNHTQQIEQQLSREPYPLPTLKLNKAKDIFSYQYSDFEFENYQHHPIIKGIVAV